MPDPALARGDASPDPSACGSANGSDSLNRLSAAATVIGSDIVDVAGFLDETDADSRRQLQVVDRIAGQSRQLVQVRDEMQRTVRDLASAGERTSATVKTSVAALRGLSQTSRGVAAWVQRLEGQMAGVEARLGEVAASNTQIEDISQQVNILAINAKIEAARAGDAGRGFSVVADAINELSQRTARASREISGSIHDLSALIETLRAGASSTGKDAQAVLDSSGTADRALADIAGNMQRTAEQTAAIADSTSRVTLAVDTLHLALREIGTALEATARGVHEARGRVNGMIDHSEALVQFTVQLGGASQDQRFIDLVQQMAAQAGHALEAAVAAGQIRMRALFERRYRPIPGTDPQQFLAPCTAITDRLFPPIQEKALEFDRRVVFCAAVDVNGYLPTHNRRFSAPQRDDAVWNAAHGRNRRMFNDRVGLKAGRSTRPFLLQTYRRDMGGGVFALMKDVSAPIRVNGRHWGGLRLAFHPQK